MCRGEFVQYLDADDLLSPDKISRQMARIGDEADVVASGQWARFYSHPSEAVFRPDAVSRDLDPVDWLTRAWTGGLPMMQAGIWLIPRAVALRAGPWDERLSLINDFEYFTRVAACRAAGAVLRGCTAVLSLGQPAQSRGPEVARGLGVRAPVARAGHGGAPGAREQPAHEARVRRRVPGVGARRLPRGAGGLRAPRSARRRAGGILAEDAGWSGLSRPRACLRLEGRHAC